MANSQSQNHAKYDLNDIEKLRIDTLISKHRDRFDLRVAASEDLSDLTNETVGEGVVKNRLKDWCFIQFRDAQRDESYVFLIGLSVEDHTNWCTSQVIATDLQQGYVRTKSGSLYELIDEPVSQPSLQLVMHVAATFRSWGMSAPLGMPVIYY